MTDRTDRPDGAQAMPAQADVPAGDHRIKVENFGQYWMRIRRYVFTGCKVIDRPNRLVFTWESPFSVDGSTVTLEFTPAGDGTLVRLTHVKFPSEESRDNHQRGWGHILQTLDGVLAEGGEHAA